MPPPTSSKKPWGCRQRRLPRIFRNMRGSVTLLVVAAVGILVALAIGDALRSGRSSSARPTAPPTTTGLAPSLTTGHVTVIGPSTKQGVVQPGPAAKQQIERNGNAWARAFATGRPRRDQSCRYQTQPLCEQNACERVGEVSCRAARRPHGRFGRRSWTRRWRTS